MKRLNLLLEIRLRWLRRRRRKLGCSCWRDHCVTFKRFVPFGFKGCAVNELFGSFHLSIFLNWNWTSKWKNRLKFRKQSNELYSKIFSYNWGETFEYRSKAVISCFIAICFLTNQVLVQRSKPLINKVESSTK